MLRHFPLLLQVVVFVLSVSAVDQEEEASAGVPICADVDDFNICHYNGVLVNVTQRGSEDHLGICELDLLTIREDAFKNLTATHLYLDQGNRISGLKKESFRGLPRLTWLELDNNQVPLSGHLFSELGRLQSLSLKYNNIDRIPADSFAGLSSLVWLFLNNNNITSIDTDSFSNVIPELLCLWLTDNKITRVASGAFVGLTRLNRLYLSYNQLEDLPTDLFRGLNKLEILYLHNNRITNIPETLFRDLVELKVLYLQENKISTLDPGVFLGLSQLEELICDKNELSDVVVSTLSEGCSTCSHTFSPTLVPEQFVTVFLNMSSEAPINFRLPEPAILSRLAITLRTCRLRYLQKLLFT
ncbi:PREDICTED: leucine-rich repeat-containing protein 15-like [Dinoponera quadriceps]|uniref:Leucine-rich repeat-containing protein 15-like n=1 Tax=Dinoponera quadriceps TaxID=609295 RepID=A0A6P3XQQ3_DINQU|nr:PREDICTED: leucine-rich repeat-containing protein 15-like [Dinoponera quadriceps]